MVDKMVMQNAKEIAQVYQEAADYFDGKQINLSYQIKFQQYSDKIDELSGYYCILRNYLSNTNIESGRYKISLIFQDLEDKIEVEKYLDQNNDTND